MKFVSKNSNLNIILKPGMQAQPLTGSPATPTLYVRFQNGVADVKDEALVKMMLNHPGFNQDFISTEDAAPDPFAYLRTEGETHVLTEMKYGHPVARNVSPVQTKLPPEILKMIQDQATAIAKQMLPSMVQAVLTDMVSSSNQAKAAESSVDTGTIETVASDTTESVTPDGATVTDQAQTSLVQEPEKTPTRGRGRPSATVVQKN